MDRLTFLKQVGGGTLAVSLGLAAPLSPPRRYKAAVIGSTGKGNYGHGLDQLFEDHPAIDVVAVADPDPAGRVHGQARTRAQRAYADYRELLEKEHPDLVVVAPRWSQEHHAIALAALSSGAHIYSEKPFTQTLAEADELIALADRKNLKICVSLQSRLAPSILYLKRQLDAGVIGDLLEIRMNGKQEDKRAGGEDMLVLAIHQYDLARFLVGDPSWCSARIRQRGHEATRADVHPASEAGDGLIVGDEIEAMFAFPKGVNGFYHSSARHRDVDGPYGMQVVGTKGIIRLHNGFNPPLFLRQGNGEAAKVEWIRLPGDPSPVSKNTELDQAAGNRRLLEDWIAAIEQNREPTVSGRAATRAFEMIQGVFAAGLTGTRVALPMADRSNPLTRGA